MHLLLAVALLVQDEAAEDALKRIEETLEKAKTLNVRVQALTQKNSGEKDVSRGSLQFKEGGRVRLELKSMMTTPGGILIVSDGRRMRVTTPGPTTDKEAPKDLQDRLTTSFARGGEIFLMMALLSDGMDAKKYFEVASVQSGPDDGGKKTLVYKLSFPADAAKGIAVKLWYEPKTWTLSKRTFSVAGPMGLDCTEIYEEFALDKPIADDVFTLSPAPAGRGAGEALDAALAHEERREKEAAKDKLPEIGKYPPPPANGRKVKVAILEFQDATQTPRLSVAASEQFETLAVFTQRFDLLPREQLKKLLKEQKLDGIADPAELFKLGKIQGVDYLFVGAITNFRLITQPQGSGGIFDKAGPKVTPVDTSKMIIATDIRVDFKLVKTATGEIISRPFGELKKEMTAATLGIRVLGIGGDAKNNVQVDQDSQAKLLRIAVDDAIRKMLPDVDSASGTPVPVVCPKCKAESPAGAKACSKCATSFAGPKCKCGAELEQNAKFCGKCGAKQ